MLKDNNQNQWKEKVNNYKSSRKGQAAWCRENNIHPKKFKN